METPINEANMVTIRVLLNDMSVHPLTLNNCDLNMTIGNLKRRIAATPNAPGRFEQLSLIIRGKRFSDDTPLRVALAPIEGTEFAVHLSIVRELPRPRVIGPRVDPALIEQFRRRGLRTPQTNGPPRPMEVHQPPAPPAYEPPVAQMRRHPTASASDTLPIFEGANVQELPARMWLINCPDGQSYLLIEGSPHAVPQAASGAASGAAPAATEPRAEVPGQAQPQEANAGPNAGPPGQAHPQEANAGQNAVPPAANAIERAIGSAWLFIQLYAIIWMMTPEDSWVRSLGIVLAAAVAWAQSSGLLARVGRVLVDSFHRHVENLVARPDGHAHAHPENIIWGWLLRIKRSVALLLASMIPGIGEQQAQVHNAAQELAERQRLAPETAPQEQAAVVEE